MFFLPYASSAAKPDRIMPYRRPYPPVDYSIFQVFRQLFRNHVHPVYCRGKITFSGEYVRCQLLFCCLKRCCPSRRKNGIAAADTWRDRRTAGSALIYIRMRTHTEAVSNAAPDRFYRAVFLAFYRILIIWYSKIRSYAL